MMLCVVLFLVTTLTEKGLYWKVVYITCMYNLQRLPKLCLYINGLTISILGQLYTFYIT